VSRLAPLVVLALCLLPTAAHADKRGVIRIGVTPIDLATDADTPLLGTRIDDAVGAYNTAADAYNEAHGYAPGSPMATDSIAPGDLGVHATLLTVAPALEAGHENAYVRIEAMLGFADDLRQYGVGFYPLNLAGRVHRGSAFVAYVSAGGSASWLDRPSTDDELGALLSARGAVGIRFRQRVTVEVGYAAFVLGALVDRGRIRTMEDYDPRGSTPPPSPSEAIAGGEQRGLVDLSLGVAF
jgi:hypothetical protein